MEKTNQFEFLSLMEESNFNNQKIIDLLIEGNDIDDIIKEYKMAIDVNEEETDDMTPVISYIMSNISTNTLSRNEFLTNVLNQLNEKTFISFLTKLGIKNEDQQLALAIKNRLKLGDVLTMNELLLFTEKYGLDIFDNEQFSIQKITNLYLKTSNKTEKPDTKEASFNEVLRSMGLDDQGIIRANKIKMDIQNGNSPDMNEILSFTQEYKQQISAGNGSFDFEKIASLLDINIPTPPTPNTTNTTNTTNATNVPNIDFNQIFNTLTPLLANFTNQSKNTKRTTKHYRKK